MFASVFFARANKGSEGLAGTFEALRDAEESMPPSESRGIVTDSVDSVIGRMLASHPSVTERLERARGTVTGEFPRPPCSTAYATTASGSRRSENMLFALTPGAVATRMTAVRARLAGASPEGSARVLDGAQSAEQA